jgi:hypothetical protein
MAGNKPATRFKEQKVAGPNDEYRPSKMPSRLTFAEKHILRQENEVANLAPRLFKLPGELRSSIYEMCLGNTDVTVFHSPFQISR